MRLTFSVVGTALLALATGCMPTAAVGWSPDGRRAVYATYPANAGTDQARWTVLDAAGKPVADLDAQGTRFAPWFGGNVLPAAWSADSQTLYFTRQDEPDHPVELCRWANGKVSPVGSLGTDEDVLQLRPSPDGQWLVVLYAPQGSIAASDLSPTAGLRLVAVHLPDQVHRSLAAAAGMGCCFTGPARLAFIRADDDGKGRPTGTAKLVELDLSADPPADGRPPDATPLADVLLSRAGEVEPVSDGLLFLSVPQSFPAAPSTDDPAHDGYTLYHWTRATGRLAAVADHLLYFTPSPDGSRVLTLRSAGDRHFSLDVLNADGTGRRTIRDLPNPKVSLLPAWHGNDRVTFQSEPGTDQPQGDGTRTVFDLVDIPLPPAGPPGTPTVLSHGWPDELRPAFVGGNPPQPAAVQSPR